MPLPRLRFRADTYTPGYRQEPHSHSELQLSLVLCGRMAESASGRTEVAGALSIAVKDPGHLHANRFGEGGVAIARLDAEDTPLASLIGDSTRAEGWRWHHDLAGTVPFLRIVRRAVEGQIEFDPDDDDLVELLAMLTARPASIPAGAPPAWLRDAMGGMREGWRPGLTVGVVARAAQVHPVYLARCIRRWYGVGAAEVLRRSRLEHAADAMVRSTMRLSAIAHAAGFSDEPHLCRDFARAVGVTPGRYRHLARAVGSRPAAAPA